MPAKPLSEELILMLQAIAEDRELVARLLSLEQLPPPMRSAQLLSIAAQMRAAGEDATVADAVTALAQPQIYAAACHALRDL